MRSNFTYFNIILMGLEEDNGVSESGKGVGVRRLNLKFKICVEREKKVKWHFLASDFKMIFFRFLKATSIFKSLHGWVVFASAGPLLRPCLHTTRYGFDFELRWLGRHSISKRCRLREYKIGISKFFNGYACATTTKGENYEIEVGFEFHRLLRKMGASNERESSSHDPEYQNVTNFGLARRPKFLEKKFEVECLRTSKERIFRCVSTYIDMIKRIELL